MRHLLMPINRPYRQHRCDWLAVKYRSIGLACGALAPVRVSAFSGRKHDRFQQGRQNNYSQAANQSTNRDRHRNASPSLRSLRGTTRIQQSVGKSGNPPENSTIRRKIQQSVFRKIQRSVFRKIQQAVEENPTVCRQPSATEPAELKTTRKKLVPSPPTPLPLPSHPSPLSLWQQRTDPFSRPQTSRTNRRTSLVK